MDDVELITEAVKHGNHAITIAALVVIYRQVARLDKLETQVKMILKKLKLS